MTVGASPNGARLATPALKTINHRFKRQRDLKKFIADFNESVSDVIISGEVMGANAKPASPHVIERIRKKNARNAATIAAAHGEDTQLYLAAKRAEQSGSPEDDWAFIKLALNVATPVEIRAAIIAAFTEFAAQGQDYMEQLRQEMERLQQVVRDLGA